MMLLRLHLSLTLVSLFVSLLGSPSPWDVNLGSFSLLYISAGWQTQQKEIGPLFPVVLTKGTRKVFISPLWNLCPLLRQAS